jgi:hypothetical protein
MERQLSPLLIGAAAVLVAIALHAALHATAQRGRQHPLAPGDAV